LATPGDFLDVVGEALGVRAQVVVLPVARLSDDFFALRTGLAGEVLQKAANYRLRVAVVGDVSPYAAASDAFRDLVRECDRGSSVYFVADLAALEGRLQR